MDSDGKDNLGGEERTEEWIVVVEVLSDREEEMKGLRFVYYTEETLRPLVGDVFEWTEFSRYKEMKKDDSFYVVLKRK